MTELTGAEINHLAKLARLSLSEEEQDSFSSQLPKIVDFVDTLDQVSEDAPSDIELPVKLSELREDKVGSDFLRLEQLESLAPVFEQDQVVVPPVLGNEENA